MRYLLTRTLLVHGSRPAAFQATQSSVTTAVRQEAVSLNRNLQHKKRGTFLRLTGIPAVSAHRLAARIFNFIPSTNLSLLFFLPIPIYISHLNLSFLQTAYTSLKSETRIAANNFWDLYVVAPPDCNSALRRSSSSSTADMASTAPSQEPMSSHPAQNDSAHRVKVVHNSRYVPNGTKALGHMLRKCKSYCFPLLMSHGDPG